MFGYVALLMFGLDYHSNSKLGHTFRQIRADIKDCYDS
jgi:hypothetical protein